MPIIENDPWRRQYFENISCPVEVVIPTDDMLSYQMYPDQNWVYNKLRICETQNIEHGPHGLIPSAFPVFSKPIYNLRGMGTGSRIINNSEELERYSQPGHFWMPLLQGEHISSDIAVINGVPEWWKHTIGLPMEQGMFNYWTVMKESRSDIEKYCRIWLGKYLNNYTGMVNLETIGGSIIDCHLRLSDQWVDLNGANWVESVIELYTHNIWNFKDKYPKTGYSIALFGNHGQRYKKIDNRIINEFLKRPYISSIQLTFYEDKLPELHVMPHGGFRLAIINCWDLDTGIKLRETIASLFGVK